MSAHSALRFMIKNPGLVDRAKRFIDHNPGTTWEPLHKHLTEMYDLKTATTRLVLLGLKATGYIVPTGRHPQKKVKTWAAKNTMHVLNIEEACERVILVLLEKKQWLSRLLDQVRESLPNQKNRDTLTVLQKMVAEEQIFGVRTRFTEKRLYPDVMLSRRRMDTPEAIAEEKIELETSALELRWAVSTRKATEMVNYLRGLKNKGVTSITQTAFYEAIGIPRSTAKRYIKKLKEQGVIKVDGLGGGRGNATRILL